jgi:hypothetical protein
MLRIVINLKRGIKINQNIQAISSYLTCSPDTVKIFKISPRVKKKFLITWGWGDGVASAVDLIYKIISYK